VGRRERVLHQQQSLDDQPERLLGRSPRGRHHRGRLPLGAPGRSARTALYNDYNIAGEDGTNAKSDAVFTWLKQMLAQGVPINGVGNQGHLDTQFGFSGTQMTQDLQRYASLGLKVAITEADVRTFVNNATDQVPTDHLATFAQPDEFGQMLKACLAVRQCTSFTVWGFGDADSWVPGFFTGEGYATIYDVNVNPKPAYTELQQDLRLAVGAPYRVSSGAGR
jgi:endo-1,4-beta-xylanase